uniref:Peptidase S8/S53 domain-containing protein n=1 Tax=Panagrolaimus davidi TaxID=227884 RepID=A0A914PWP0_9BILA
MSFIFTIGAVLTSKIRKEVFLVRKTKKDKNVLPPVVAEYSSRGPGHKGSRGVDFVAPCSAITDSSRFVFGNKKGPWLKRRHGGTSIASPNAAGAVACLLSALKANSIQYSPFTLKFALFKTAYLPENGIKFEFGHGIIQINNAFDYCKREIDFTKIPKYLPESGGICRIEDDEETINYRFITVF